MSWDLVADIGGTNMRVAQVADGQIIHRQDFPMTPERRVAATLRDVAQSLGGAPRAVVCAGAGPVIDREIRLTNGGWLVSEDEIADVTGAARVQVINDFEAAAWSLATLSDTDVTAIGGTKPLTHGHRVALGPGTGLGAGTLMWDGAKYRVVPGEGGHVAIGPRTADEVPVFERMCALWPETQLAGTITIEAEAMLSGVGLPVLHEAVGGAPGVTGREIFAAAANGDATAQRTAKLFQSHLAALAGNLAVTVKATGGIFLVGGVAQANRTLFDADFWRVFSEGGRFTALRQSCGVYLVNVTDFGLRGAVNALMAEQGALRPNA